MKTNKYRSLNYRNDLRVNHDTITRLKAPQITQQTLSNRKRKHKTFFLTKTEAKAFSQYLGYDLMKN